MNAVPVEKLRAVRQVYAHSHCPDGLSAAMTVTAAYASIGLSPDVQFVQYDTNEHANLQPGPHQLFVDITPPLARWQEWEGHDPVVLDHHETAKPAVLGLGGVYGDTSDSGASLAYKHVFRPLFQESPWKAPAGKTRESVAERWARFAFLGMVRDTWKDGHEQWKDACALAEALNFYTARPLLASAGQVDLDLDEMLRFGRVLYKKVEWKASQMAKGSFFFDHAGKKFAVFNCTEKLVSEACHEALSAHACDVACAFFYKMEGTRLDISLSLRSHKPEKGGVPVNKLAEHFGGGGHPPAAGFRVKDARDCSFSDLVLKLREGYDYIASRSDPGQDAT